MLLHDTVHSSGILNSYANTNEVGEDMSAWKLHAQQENVQLLTQKTNNAAGPDAWDISKQTQDQSQKNQAD